MTLAEKLTALRGERKLSQGDVAEKLDVSRQSVSKWETGQAVPELDKIIKLADLFGVTVDELVRDGETPQAETSKLEVAERIVYVERKTGLTPVQILGVICAVVGGGMILVGFLGAAVLIIPGLALVMLSLPLLLVKKHPWLIAGWVAVAMIWLFVGPLTGASPLRPWMAFEWIYYYFTQPGPGRASLLLGGIITIARSTLTLVLVFFTARLCWKKWKSREGIEQKAGG